MADMQIAHSEILRRGRAEFRLHWNALLSSVPVHSSCLSALPLAPSLPSVLASSLAPSLPPSSTMLGWPVRPGTARRQGTGRRVVLATAAAAKAGPNGGLGGKRPDRSAAMRAQRRTPLSRCPQEMWGEWVGLVGGVEGGWGVRGGVQSRRELPGKLWARAAGAQTSRAAPPRWSAVPWSCPLPGPAAARCLVAPSPAGAAGPEPRCPLRVHDTLFSLRRREFSCS